MYYIPDKINIEFSHNSKLGENIYIENNINYIVVLNIENNLGNEIMSYSGDYTTNKNYKNTVESIENVKPAQNTDTTNTYARVANNLKPLSLVDDSNRAMQITIRHV